MTSPHFSAHLLSFARGFQCGNQTYRELCKASGHPSIKRGVWKLCGLARLLPPVTINNQMEAWLVLVTV